MFSGIPAEISAKNRNADGTTGRQAQGGLASFSLAAEDFALITTISGATGQFQFTSGRLLVDALVSSDIQIGAVEIKNGTTDDRVVVRNDGVEFAMVVLQNSQPLPTGAATEATLATRATEATLALIKAKTDNLDTALSTRATEATLATRATEATLLTRATEATVATLGTEATLALIKAKTDNLDVLLSTRTKPADSQIVTGTLIVTQATGTNLHVVVDSGTITANIGTTNGLALDATLTKLTIPPGTAIGTNTGAMIMGSVTTNAPAYTTGQINPINMTVTGRVRTSASPVDGDKETFSASAIGIAPATTPLDVFTLTGSSTRTVRITKITLSGTQTTTGTIDVLLIKRSTANTGGTSTTPAIVPHDSTNAAATAVFRAYTVDPTLGTAVGNVLARKINIPSAVDDVLHSDGVLFEAVRPGQAIVLRGVGEMLAVSLNSVTLTGGNLDCTFEFTEEV